MRFPSARAPLKRGSKMRLRAAARSQIAMNRASAAPPAPMPRLVADAGRVFLRIRKMETKTRRVGPQPPELCRAAEAFIEIGVLRRADVQRPAGVVFAATRRGDDQKDMRERFAAREFVADDFRLPSDAAKPGERQKCETIAGCGGL